MAIFSNQAALTFNGVTTNSNVAFGEILEVLAMTKDAVEGSYTAGDVVTYTVALRNTGSTALTGLTLSDDLGGYAVGTAGTTAYPLTYVAGSAQLYVNGVAQAAPTVTAGPPLAFTGITVPAGGNAVLVYQTRANEFADPAAGGTIVNTVTATGAGLTAPITADATLGAAAEPVLSIAKSISPSQVVDNDRVTYTFLLQNAGATAVDATDNAVITDTFDPRLTDLTVTYNGVTWTPGTNYTYDQATGLFTTLQGQLAIPAATATQDIATGAYTVTPGTATLTVTGTI